ncbi:MAG: glycosyltransferase family 4 protein [Alphaproteobacteria bacterium]|nr:MAG: hypothetical protein B6I23_00680 [Rickettsiaceae bacterium 4572_127]
MKIINIMLSNSDMPFGTEKVAYKHTEMFLEKGHEVLFIHKNNYDTNQIKKHKNLSFFQMKNKGFINLFKARFFIKKWRPDVIFVHNFFSRLRFIGVGIAPMIGIAHLERFKSLKNYEGVISLRPDSVEKAVSEGVKKNKIAVIPNTCNLSGVVKKKKIGKIPVIGAIGRLNSEKNFSTLIKALGLLKIKKIKFKAVLAGFGSYENELRKLVKKEKIEKEFKFLGFENDPKKFYEKIDIFCVPSSFEPFGLVLLEAMFCSKAIVASSVISFQQILDKKSGILSETFSPESFSKNLEKLIANPKKSVKMGDEARKRYDKNYSSKIVYEKLIEFIRKLKI